MKNSITLLLLSILFITLSGCDFGLSQAQVSYVKGAKYHEKGDYARALASYNNALKLDPNMIEAYNSRGILREILYDYDGAMLDYNEVITRSENSPKGYEGRGHVEFIKKNYQASLKDYEKALRLDPEKALLFYYAGENLRLLGKRGEALNYLVIAKNKAKAKKDASTYNKALASEELILADVNYH